MLDLGPRVLEQRADLDLGTRGIGQPGGAIGDAEHVVQRAVAEHARLDPRPLVVRAREVDAQPAFEQPTDLVDVVLEVRDDAQPEQIRDVPQLAVVAIRSRELAREARRIFRARGDRVDLEAVPAQPLRDVVAQRLAA